MSATRAAAARACLVSVLCEAARRSGGESRVEPGLVLISSPDPCPMVLNSAFADGRIAPREAVARADAYYAARGSGYELWTTDGEDDLLAAAARASGMRIAARLSGMTVDVPPALPSPQAATAVRTVGLGAELADFTNVVASGFSAEAPGTPGLVRTTFATAASVRADDTAAVVVYVDDIPAAAAFTMVHGQAAWVGWVATLREFRGRGLGSLAAAAATRAGFERGAKYAVLEATASGEGVYDRLGYRAIARLTTYWPASVPPWPPGK